MKYVTLRSDFADHGEYRLLAVDPQCAQELREKVTARTLERSGESGSLRENSGDFNYPQEDDRTLLMIKGKDQLLLCNGTQTFRVRRVEYSNMLLLAEEHPMSESEAEAFAHTSRTINCTAGSSELKDKKKHVVVCAAERIFEARPARAYRDAFLLLEKDPITIEELEADVNNSIDEENFLQDTAAAAASVVASPVVRNKNSGKNHHRHYTFPELVALSRCSARELADMLSDAGAVVHCGCVRLLDPSLLREALQAVLFFFEGAECATWEAAESHLCPAVYTAVVLHAVRAVFGRRDPPAPGETAAAALLNARKVLQALAAATILTDADTTAVTTDDGGDDSAEEGEVRSFPSLEFERFYNAWVDRIPASFFACGAAPPRANPPALLALLHGAVIVSGEPRHLNSNANGSVGVSVNVGSASVVWAPHESLPAELSRRIRRLFALRSGRWEAAALRAYVEPLLDPSDTFEHVVLRYAKEYRTPQQPVTYGSLA
ncbi:sister chromatid cohesion protein DCC1 [Trypanosoma theileri]|uniref:Sister chromatid cohesion protein DCC1 n=1 Tax=Trypanosoma theileri TaxID=67003 RepID=A0A1X0NTK3_9TRYP|nr:sister chromatid cohesion protein DCC1 [Trypanosoma theileri]ORC87868.1 sister chromatid cohesion protein DCC1 [Trypanosoma theileri]